MAFCSIQIMVHDLILPDIGKSKIKQAETYQIQLFLGAGCSKGIDTLGQSGNLSGRIALVDRAFADCPVNGRDCDLKSGLCILQGILLNGNPN
jgi:hypothetical protein